MAKKKEKSAPENPYINLGYDLDLIDRAKENIVTSTIFSFKVDEEVAGIYVTSETAENGKSGKGKKVDMEPSQIHTLIVDGVQCRFWGFGLLDYLLEKNNIKSGDAIFVKKTDKNEKGFWGCDFGFAQKV